MSFFQGKIAENHVIELFTQCGIPAEKTSKELKQYDITIKLGRKACTCEIKYDIMSEKTGNLAIEYWNSRQNKASGISATTSELWIQCIRDGGNIVVFATRTKKLKEWMERNPPKRTILNAGDKNANLYLYDLDLILNSVFTRMDNVTKEEFPKLLKKVLK